MNTEETNEQQPFSKRGGKRLGAGRRPRPDRVVSASIALRPNQWEKLDSMRGELSRSAWIRSAIEASDASKN
jgi:hypothetical protein